MTNEILQTLPSTRQRNSLLAVGMNLNIPDEDPKLANSNNQMYKKRFNISEYNDTGRDGGGGGFESRRFEERENKIPRTAFKNNSSFLTSMECDDNDAAVMNAMNLSTTNRRASNSLMDLSAACENERRQFEDQPTMTATSSMSSLSSSNSSINCSVAATTFPSVIVRKPLQSNTSSNVKLVNLGSSPVPVNRWVGFGRSKTVIALVSPSSNGGTSNCYPAVQTSPVSLVMKKRTSFD